MQGTPQQLPGASFPAGTAAPLSFHGDIQITASAQPGKRTTASIQAPSMSIPESSSAHDRDTYIKKLGTGAASAGARDDDDDDEGGFAYHERTLWDSVVHTGHLFWRWARFMCLDDCYACSARGVRLVTTGSSHAAYQPMAATTDQGDFESAL
mmetsp:Transcript_21329/g.53791  ORF Transcript_21329/g.53791 Transcript_21329/m.53791 type:complete len:153 (-) Transcript_21329:233-691(-)|eukprot:CAMPEP_0177631298 /NCGR_PEP_ID=MMETSP0447-20121125/1673_1 /TAXON_ID=0 /ORGANISM="Stygamoeba regulata, Strain BSH-02190019" /LENGTH=152 /DNA_ID=CAMNT_0019132769 /DNA_START=57 /DNA_END=515 /DNA_ORIENTATION=-